MGALGDLSANLKLTGGTSMVSGLKGVGSAAGAATSALSAMAGPLALLGVSFGAFKSVTGIADGLKGVFEAGRDLQTLSNATGESVGNLKMLQGAFKAAGLSAEEVPNALRAMQRAIGGVNEEGQPTSATLTRLGVNIQALKGMDAAKQMQTLQAAFAKLPDTTTQNAAAMQVFAREGQSMMALFRDPAAMAGLGKGLSSQAQIFQRDSAMFARITQDLGMIGGKVSGLFVGIADGVAPVILPLLDKIKSIDLTPIGQQIGSIVGIIAAAFKNGSIGELIGDSLMLGGMKFTNFMSGAIVGIGQGLGAAASLYVDIMSEYFSHFPTYIAALKDGFVGAVQFLGAALLEVMQKPIVAFQSGLQLAIETIMEKLGSTPLLGKALGLEGFQASSYDDIAAERQKQGATLFGSSSGDLAAKAQDNFDKSAAGLKTTFGSVDFAGGLKSILTEFQNGMKAGTVYDAAAMGDVQNKLSGLVGKLQDAAKVTAAPSATKGAGTGDFSLGGASKQVDGDRLARIGLFVGGAGGPALDYQKRTASATEQIAKGINKLTTGHLTTGHLGTAVWA